MVNGVKNDKVNVQGCRQCPRLVRFEQTFVPQAHVGKRGLMPKRGNGLHFIKPPLSRSKAKLPSVRSLCPSMSLIMEKQPIVDVFEEEDCVLILAELPGMDEKDVKVRANENVVTITAENATKKYLETVKLPMDVSKGAIKFTYKNNVLQARLRKTRHPRK
jgi:HSP20 family molecular chaperone IbpA